MKTVKIIKDQVQHYQRGQILSTANFPGGEEEAKRLVDDGSAEWYGEPAKPPVDEPKPNEVSNAGTLDH